MAHKARAFINGRGGTAGALFTSCFHKFVVRRVCLHTRSGVILCIRLILVLFLRVYVSDPNTMGDAFERGEVDTNTDTENLNYEVRARGKAGICVIGSRAGESGKNGKRRYSTEYCEYAVAPLSSDHNR